MFFYITNTKRGRQNNSTNRVMNIAKLQAQNERETIFITLAIDIEIVDTN